MRTIIRSGIVGGVATSIRQTKLFALSSPAFSLGESAETFYIPGGWEYVPFKAGDFVAIAGKRTIVPGVQYVALAYRRLGVGGPGYGIGRLAPLFGVGAGLIGAYFTYLGALADPIGREIFIPMLVIGGLGLYRLMSIQAAARQLDGLEIPLTTHSSGP